MKKIEVVNIVALIFSVICCSGSSSIMPLRIYLIGLLAGLVLLQNCKSARLTLINSPIFFAYVCFLIYLVINSIYSYDVTETIKYFYVFLTGGTLILISINEKFYHKSVEYVERICEVVAFSIIVQLIIPNLYRDYLFFFIRGGKSSYERLTKEISNNIFSGIVGEKGEAAYLMVLALIIVLGKCACEKKINKKNGLLIALFLFALLLPAKRMLFLIAIIIFFLYLLFWTKGSAKFISIGLFGFFGIFTCIVVSILPMMNTLFVRFVKYSGDDATNGREYLWEYAINMFHDSPLLGYGYGSFNKYASERGVILSSSRLWNAHAHNIYFQLLGETGIIGFTLFVILAVIGMICFVLLYKRKDDFVDKDYKLLFIGGNIQVMNLLYGLTGNVIYNTNQMLVYFWGLSIIVYLYKKYLHLAEKK